MRDKLQITRTIILSGFKSNAIEGFSTQVDLGLPGGLITGAMFKILQSFSIYSHGSIVSAFIIHRSSLAYIQ